MVWVPETKQVIRLGSKYLKHTEPSCWPNMAWVCIWSLILPNITTIILKAQTTSENG